MTTEARRLYRSREERMIAGVCGGLAEYLALDPTLVRLLFLGALFLGAPGVIPAYLIMAVIVPPAPEVREVPEGSDLALEEDTG